MTRHLLLAQSAIRQFGLVVNPDKTEGPAQSLSFLGVQLDSVNTDRVVYSSARGGAHSTATLPPPPASHHKGSCCITDRQALLRSTGSARRPSLHATHVGRPAPVQIQATLDTHPHRPRLPGRPALLGTAASSLERQTAMALITSCPIRLRLRRQPQRGFGFYLESTPTLSNSTVNSTLGLDLGLRPRPRARPRPRSRPGTLRRGPDTSG